MPEPCIRHSQNASSSRWMPWELGYFDGTHGPEKVAICPIVMGPGQHVGQEYLNLYKTRTRCVMPRSLTPTTPASRSATRRSWRATPTHAQPSATTAPAATSTDAASTSSPPTSLECERPALLAPTMKPSRRCANHRHLSCDIARPQWARLSSITPSARLCS